MNDCRLDTCRYNENFECTNEEKRKACAEVVKKVLVYQNKQGEIPIWASNMIGNIESLKKFGIEIDLSDFETQGVVLIKRSEFMTDRQVKLELMDKLEQIAKEIAKGNDVYITKSASGVVIKKMTVGKV
jgi:hypothetical protein